MEWSAESHSDSEDDDEDAHPGHAPKTSLAYTEFLQFLELGCGGSPIHGYPTVVIILSTIPSSVRILPLTSIKVLIFDDRSSFPLNHRSPLGISSRRSGLQLTGALSVALIDLLPLSHFCHHSSNASSSFFDVSIVAIQNLEMQPSFWSNK